MKLSQLSINDCGVLKRRRFIVTYRCPDDRSSGITQVRYEGGREEDFIWDYDNPEVEYLGVGSVVVQITFPKTLAALEDKS